MIFTDSNELTELMEVNSFYFECKHLLIISKQYFIVSSQFKIRLTKFSNNYKTNNEAFQSIFDFEMS